ncbi:MAG: hypothetical protein A2V91_01720 [Candidatus Muproteobacteria bacterium RBG_16_64_10]|uniref:DUF4145 domain-containing protein n=1 Tax=Candidatus Muproteobacteria bacterium RBG_16_64_10 TaxID=1817757 RepID=A0A1F6SY08_9PROT|nr:MAG: hypothetical protein A2V91_01720 [Candidatus Muproteobacteria bacterium RBG_16_64_10]
MNTESDQLVRFMKGLAATAELHARAGRLGCFIESVCLCASMIDGALRMGLILKHQLNTRSAALLPELLYQGETDTPISERDVYRRALANGVIDKATFDELNTLYDDRNRVIHCYIISDITTAQVLDIAIRYDKVKNGISEHIGELEAIQIRENVGMTVRDDTTFGLHELLNFSEDKHGSGELAKKVRS